jgi:hypothetical protein
MPLSARRLLATLFWGIAWYEGSVRVYGVFPHEAYVDLRMVTLFQILAVAAWEAAAFRRKDAAWLPAPWLPRLVAALGLGALTGIAIMTFGQPGRELDLVAYAAVVAGIWHWHRRKRRDLFMLNLGLLSLTVFLLVLISMSPLGGAGMMLGLFFILLVLCAGAWGPVQRRLWGRDAEADPGVGPEAGTGTGLEPGRAVEKKS